MANVQREQSQLALSEVSPALRRKINLMLEEAGIAFDKTYVEEDADQGRIFKLRNRARTLALKVLTREPENENALNLLGRIALDEGKLLEAAEYLDTGLQIHPNSASLHYSRAHVYLGQQNYKQAESLFVEAESLAPTLTRSRASLAYTRTRQGNYVEAFADYRELILQDPTDPHIRSKLFECIRHIQADYYAADLEQELITYLDFTQVDHNDLGNLIASVLIHKYDLLKGRTPLDPQVLSDDVLLNKALRKVQFRNPVVEEFLTACRQCILQEAISHRQINDCFMEFLVSISLQCVNNEFVYTVSLTEEKVLAELISVVNETVQFPDWHTSDIEYPILLLSMYELLHRHSFRDQLLRKSLTEWGTEVQKVISAHLYNPQRELEIQRAIQPLTPIVETTSIAVGQQYEENPYPRWTNLPHATKTDYGQALAAELPGFTPPSFMSTQTIRVLIAGCGTGKHAIQVAKNFRNVDVTAIDLSRSSLAYAIQQARHLALTNISFHQGDILELHNRLNKFHIVESSGVLHHMIDPIEGWQALRNLLEPGGLMKVGLYSARARRVVSYARQVIAENQLKPTREHIRLFRQVLLDNLIDGDFSAIVQSPDFYNLSGVRDLLFNVEEKLFTPLQIQEALAEVDLGFLGFVNLAPEVRTAFDSRFPDDPSRQNLAHWETLEASLPASFGTMFQFYCQLQGDAPAAFRTGQTGNNNQRIPPTRP